jgi:hypothetical protein
MGSRSKEDKREIEIMLKTQCQNRITHQTVKMKWLKLFIIKFIITSI